MRLTCLRAAIAAAATLAPTLAFAHTGHGDPVAFMSGFGHPIGGLDHVLAMVMVGVLAFQLGGRAVWLAPATFVTVMGAGGLIGMAGAEIPFVETGVALSIVVFGAMLAFGVKTPVAASMALVGLFAVFHGHAHGAEMPEAAGAAAYAAGFMLATAMLHAAGVGFGFAIGRLGESGGPAATRLAGAAAGLVGVAIFVGAI